MPRTFKGTPVINIQPFQNGTQTSFLTYSPPALHLLNNSTVGYLGGSLSTRVIPIIYTLVVTVGIPANMCLLVTKIRKVSSAILYCSLAVSDLFLLLSLFFKAHYHFHGNHWVLGETACRVVTACFYGNLRCSAMTLACISIERYLAVVYPFIYKSMPKRLCAAWVSLALWGGFGVAIIPELIIQQSYWLPQLNRTTCHDVLPLDHSSHMFLLYYHLILIVLFLMVPLVVIAVCFARFINKLTRSHSDQDHVNCSISCIFLADRSGMW
ncbi:proteinase-activated receptor 3-like [Oreochromis niloticus]|uniref:proteinase-activated receptor 3-like n=1 Tax=Oreochromis niloticus TaxID=8128 RepID=UPI000904D749|nr:proteinase-activated receptor 3-like [Oreochromis niloticus]CAI5667525.1 unnamed protein product [Mustela putorius furo]